jgi:glycosyltransferase involved in cell wall biosynthesis
MPKIAYLANLFPSAVEPYVAEEILELRRHGLQVIPCSARQPDPLEFGRLWDDEILALLPVRLSALISSAWLGLHRLPLLGRLMKRICRQGNESLSTRARAIVHTVLGLYYASLLQECDVQHIHVHHGYFSSWIGMVAAQALGIGFSMTLHGSDLLLHAAYMDSKLEACQFCFTISEFNRQYIRHAYPAIDLKKIVVQRLGVSLKSWINPEPSPARSLFLILSVGRLHAVKDHAFLIRACREFRDRGNKFLCLIAGEGPERGSLERLIQSLHLEQQVRLLGHVSQPDLPQYYGMADLVVLTSRSEGIPLALMEAMAQGKVVLAPAITGVPELVIDGQTGFLYRPGSLDDFVSKLEAILESVPTLEPIRREARRHVSQHFDRKKNLEQFRNIFLSLVPALTESRPHAHSVLQ